MQQQNEPRKVVPPRNDMAAAPVDASSRGHELDNKDPAFEYQFVSSDPKHPQYVGRYLYSKRVEVPKKNPKDDQEVLYAEPWTVVHATDDPMLKQGLRRADAGSPLDTVVKNGSQFLIKTPKANAAISRRAHDVEVEINAAKMKMSKESHIGKGIGSMTLAQLSEHATDRDALAATGGGR